MRTKTFDCVEMKRQAQERLIQEYESRKGDFESYVDFLNSTADSDPLVMAFREKHVNASPAKKRKPAFFKKETA